MTNINGFTFNGIGDLTQTPTTYTIHVLRATLAHLIFMREYISASRIQHLINVELNK